MCGVWPAANGHDVFGVVVGTILRFVFQRWANWPASAACFKGQPLGACVSRILFCRFWAHERVSQPQAPVLLAYFRQEMKIQQRAQAAVSASSWVFLGIALHLAFGSSL